MLGDIASVATALGVALAIVQLDQQRRLAKVQFEEDLVRRYWDVLDRLSLEARRGESKRPNESDLLVAHSYFKLCDEQAYLHGEGKIRDKTWASWGPGIRATMQKEPFASEWLRVVASPGGLVEYADLVRLLDGSANAA